MIKKDKLFLLFFIFSMLSIIAAIIIKHYGFDFFRLSNYTFNFLSFEIVIKFIVLIAQYLLIVGCVTQYEFKKLFVKMIPFLLLIPIMFYLPKNTYSILSCIILLVPCLSFAPKFKTILFFVIITLFTAAIQLAIIWLRLGIKQIAPAFPDALQFLIMNIDQLIILSLLYLIRRKEVIKMGFIFLGKANKKVFFSKLKKLGENVCKFFKS